VLYARPADPQRHGVFETAKGGAVFSFRSITFCGSLPWNNFNNQISVMLRNLVTRFMAE